MSAAGAESLALRRGERRAVVVGALGAVLFGAVELAHWRASRRGRAGHPDDAAEGPDVVLVLGFPSRRSGRLHPVQRWRTDIAVRSMRSPRSRLVFSGAGRVGVASEAEVMAGYACGVRGVPAEQVVVETSARTTWENVARSLGELERAATITIASSPLHAARARRYLAAQRPDLAARLRPADDYRLGERCLWKLAGVVYVLGRWYWAGR